MRTLNAKQKKGSVESLINSFEEFTGVVFFLLYKHKNIHGSWKFEQICKNYYKKGKLEFKVTKYDKIIWGIFFIIEDKIKANFTKKKKKNQMLASIHPSNTST